MCWCRSSRSQWNWACRVSLDKMKMKRSFLFHALLAMITISTVAACSALQTASTPPPPLRVEFTQWWGDYTLLVAQEKGFFEKYGVQVEPVYYNVFSEALPDLAAGQIDAGLIAIGDTININRTTPMKAVAVSDNGGDDAILAGPGISSIQDLRGGKIGVQTGSQYELLIDQMLRSAGMNTGDVGIVSVYPEDALAALRGDRVQAVYTWEPYLSEAVSSGYKIIYPQEQLHLFPDLIVFRKSIVDKRPGDVRAFLKAWFEAVNYRLQNPQETRSIAAKYVGMGLEEVQPDDNLKILTLDDNKTTFNLQSETSIYSITKTTSDYLITIGAITQLIDPLELLDPAYLP